MFIAQWPIENTCRRLGPCLAGSADVPVRKAPQALSLISSRFALNADEDVRVPGII